MIQIFDGRKVREGIACREFDWTCDTVQPLLKLIRGVGLGRAPYHSGGSYHSLCSCSTKRMLKKSVKAIGGLRLRLLTSLAAGLAHFLTILCCACLG